jgi:predicted RNA binding protein YcfA (HicA-like mRNA interferase family)
MKVRTIIKMLYQDGWSIVAIRGSHRQFKHPNKPGRVTVPGRLGDDLAVGTFKSILQQAGLEK